MQTKKMIFIAVLIGFSSQLVYGQYQEFVYKDSVRTYALFEPELDPNPDGYPLVIGLHGAGSEGIEFIGTAFLGQKALKEKFIVACPNSLHYPLAWWNAGDGYEAMTDSTDDLGFIAALIDTMIANHNVDTTRIFVMGHSNGSMMAYRVAAELSHKIAAIGINSGQMVYEYCDPEFPVPIIHFHGLEDPLCPYEGEENEQVVLPPVDSVMAIWRGINHCTSIPDTIYNTGGITGRKWASADGNSDIILYTMEGWGHSWPRTVDPGIDATDVIWDFLKDQTRSTKKSLEEKRFTYDGETRTYLVYDPSPKSGDRPLLIGMHCHTGTAAGLLTYTDLLQKVKEANCIGVFPNSLFHPMGTAWNVGSSFEWMTGGTDDVGFISALIDTMIKNYEVDSTRIYITGHSNGSMMSYRLAAELSHRIAAMGGVAAPMLYEHCDPEYPVPIIHFHGLSDTTCPYEGIVKDYVTIPPVDSALAIWIDKNNCNPIPDTLMNTNGIVGQKWASPDGKGDVVLYTIESCMHDWPVYENYGIAATDVIWDYMKIYTRGGGEINIKEDDSPSVPLNFTLYQNYPNPFNPSTKIKYNLGKSDHVVLKIYNIAGQEIATLVNELQSAGEHHITWRPEGLPSGLYFCKLTASEFSEIKKLILQK